MTNYSQNPKSKAERQDKLLGIVRSNTVTTQTELSERLDQAGFPCTQVSVSRDIRELGLVKQSGQYVAPNEPKENPELEGLASTLSGFLKRVEIVGENLVVVKTLPGTSPSVAMLLDQVNWQGLKGTIAGDDTIFVAVENKKAGQTVSRNLRKLMKE